LNRSIDSRPERLPGVPLCPFDREIDVNWFGRKAAAPAPRPPLSRALGSIAASGDWPQSYEAQVRAAVLGNPVAQRALRLVSEAAGSAPLSAQANVADDTQLALRILNARSAGQGLIETLAVHLTLHGNAYAQISHGADGMPARLYALRPDRVSVEADATGWPRAYLYKAGDGIARYPAEDGTGRTAIIHLKALHPLNDHYGLGCLGAAAGAVATHNAATRWNKGNRPIATAACGA
jgi:phage portal protein BeeE